MIKVLFFIHDLMHGGAEKVLVNLVNNIDKTKFDVTVLSLFDCGVNKKYINKDVKYRYVFKKTFKGNTLFLKLFSPKILYKFMIKEDVDIVISYLEGSCTRILGGCNNEKVKKVAWIHSTESEKEFIYSYRSLKEAIDIYKSYDKIVCVSKDIVTNFKYLTDIDKNIVVKYNTNETDKILDMSRENIRDIQMNDQYINICCVGKVVHNKGFLRLAHVCKQLWDDGYRVKVYILGIGEEKNEILNYLKENKLENIFCFLGYQENPYKYMSKCDLFVCSSYKEGFSTATTEALIVGIPVMVTECSGMKEMLGENNEYGVVIENSEQGIYDGIKYFLEDKELLNIYKEKSIERGKFFSKEKTVKEVEKMLFELMKN